jgi:CubicO group peptidase (beta-lactamase class C family)
VSNLFDRIVSLVFLAVTLSQIALGTWRARLVSGSIVPALALAGLFAAFGLLWYLRRNQLRGAWIAKPVALLAATMGALSFTSALNAPLLSVASRFSTPLLAISLAALLMLAEQEPRYQIVPLLGFIVAVAALQASLIADARWERTAALTTASGGALLLSVVPAGCASMSSDTAQIDALMRDYSGSVPGASVLVVRDGKTVVRRTYGLSNMEDNVPATPASNYRLASVTKQFTAAAILLLAQDGKLTVDDRAKRWLPSLPAAAERITIRHLLTHTSGLIDYEDVMEGATLPLRDADVLRLLEIHDRLNFQPGSAYRYSNSGYALLALIVERASEQTFATFLRNRLFVPLGMNNTVALEEGISTVPNRAYGYTLASDGWKRTDQSLTSAVLGDGGIYSSIDDLARWDAALNGTRLLTAESLREAFTPATDTDVAGAKYGFGWFLKDGRMYHTGETIGFRNAIVRDPHSRVTVLILTNRNEPGPLAAALKILEAFSP